nr:FtsX-like permease family protein [Acidobacteriota bacterium]
AMRHVDPGFTDPRSVLTLRVSIPPAIAPDHVQAARMHEQIAQRIAQVPGVGAVGVTSSITMDGNDSNDPMFVEDFPSPGERIPTLRRYKWIGPGYFGAMGNRLVAGRDLDWNDAYTKAPVVVVSEGFAREYWKDPALAVGRRVRNTPKSPWRTIVGVAGDERDDGVTKAAPTIIYWPVVVQDLRQPGPQVRRNMGYAIRSERSESPTLLKEVQAAVWAVNPSLPVAGVQTLEEIQSDSMAQTSFALVMLSIAAGVALLLGVVGIYGVIAYIAAQRTREIGIRMALGAAQRDVSSLFLRHGLVLSAIGIAIGLAGAAGLTRLMASMLFGVNPLDWVTYAAVAAGLGATALLASYLPAARAARMDPSEALRADI